MSGSRRPQKTAGGVKIHRVTSATSNFAKGPSYRLPIPAQLARMIGPDREFSLEVTDEGILFRYLGGGDPIELPPWLR